MGQERKKVIIMMKEVTRNDMEMIYGGAELNTEKKKNSEFSIGDNVLWLTEPKAGVGIVVWPGDEATTVTFLAVAVICTIPNDELVKIC